MISENKLWKGDGRWGLWKKILGWILDTHQGTLELAHRMTQAKDQTARQEEDQNQEVATSVRRTMIYETYSSQVQLPIWGPPASRAHPCRLPLCEDHSLPP